MIQQKPEFITRQIRKLAREVGSLADNIDNHHERGKFYSELLKNKIFELYESNNLLMELLNEKTSSPNESSQTTFIKNEEVKQEKPIIVEEKKEEPKVIEKEEVSYETVSEKEIPEIENSPKTIEVETPQERLKEETPAYENPTHTVEHQINDEITKVETPSEEVTLESTKHTAEFETVNNNFQSVIKKEETWLYKNMIAAMEKTGKSGDIAEKKQDQPLKSLGNAISISQKHEFISALFAGESNGLKDAIQKIESMNSFDDAVVWMDQALCNQNNWKKNEKLSFEFTNLVRRRFLN